MIDYHVHSVCSGDAEGTIIDMCAAAVERGFSEICFTEHVDFEPSDPCYNHLDIDVYRRQLDQARECFAGRLDIRFGVEVDYQAKYSSQIHDFIDGAEFDYVIGAAHYVEGILLEYHHRYFPGKSAERAYGPFFENTLAAVRTGWFDSLAHLDLCKRHGVRYFGPFDPTPHWDQIEEILGVVIEHGLTLEVNSSGLRQSPGEIYPSQDILERYYAMGGRRITVGSDSHRPAHAGAGIREALELVRGVGFTELDIYRERKRLGKAI